MKEQFVTIYGVEKCVVFGLVFLKSLICCVKIIHPCPALIGYYPCVIVKVYVEVWAQLSVDGDPEFRRNCRKGEYVCKGFSLKKLQKVTFLELWCDHSLSVHNLDIP